MSEIMGPFYDPTNVAITGGTITGVVITDAPFAASTDPAINAAVSTAIINAYNGVLITLTGAGNAQTIQNPTTVTAGKRFSVINNDTSGANTITVNGITIVAGKAQTWIWDGTVWVQIDIGITTLPVPVNQGGTGDVTLSDGGLLVGAGTGVVEVLPVGATTELLVGGGPLTNPLWTTATGTGAPVRADSPVFTTNVSMGGCKWFGSATSVLDNGTVALPTITANSAAWGQIVVSASGLIEQSASFQIDSTGNAEIISATSGVVANADTGGKLCLGTAAGQNPMTVKNRLGGTKTVMITMWYN